MFGRIWDQAALPRPVAGQQPRPYDFRHHFAYACIERWMRQRKDVAAMLPYLSRYMGHATIESTYYYIHTSPDFMDWTLEVVLLPVADLDRAIEFYRDKVGFDLDHDTRNEYMRPLTLSAFASLRA